MRISLERTGPAAAVPEPILPISRPDRDSTSSFSTHLAASLQTIEATTAQADENAEGMVTGEVDLHTAMISMEKADIMLKVGSTVRNKLLDAYRQLTQLG